MDDDIEEPPPLPPDVEGDRDDDDEVVEEEEQDGKMPADKPQQQQQAVSFGGEMVQAPFYEQQQQQQHMMAAGGVAVPTAPHPHPPYHHPPPATLPFGYHHEYFVPPPPAGAFVSNYQWGAKPQNQVGTAMGWAGNNNDNNHNNHTTDTNHYNNYNHPQHPQGGGVLVPFPHAQPPLPNYYYLPVKKRAPKKKKTTNIVRELESDPRPLETDWKDLVNYDNDNTNNDNAPPPVFVCPALLDDISPDLYLAVSQFQFCGVTHDDRIGKYKNRELGYVGLCCKFCQGQPGFGRYFPGSYDSFLNGTNCEGIVKHIQECRNCPEKIRNKVTELAHQEPEPTTRPRYGSRKRFFSYVWTKLRNHELMIQKGTADAATTNNTNETSADDQKIRDILQHSTIVDMSDRHLISDLTLVAMAQMQVCHLLPEDRIGRCKDHPLGFAGLACSHCGGKSGKPGYGRYFPSSLRSLAQADSCQQIIKHVSQKCPHVPADIRTVMAELSKSSVLPDENNSGGRIKYGSRKIFFKRVWGRIHDKQHQHDNKATTTTTTTTNNNTVNTVPAADVTIPWDTILGDSPVVKPTDRGLIPDAQLAAIAQMKFCKLSTADRVGWFKDRQVGFGGLCCKHCGGRPSFGRYFPNSVRSFAQTTSSQTIISHITMYCQAVPMHIRDMVVKLQQMEDTNDVSETAYGSRKVFFDRVWKRMHGTSEKDTKGASSSSSGTAASALDHLPQNYAEQMVEMAAVEPDAKRPKIQETTTAV